MYDLFLSMHVMVVFLWRHLVFKCPNICTLWISDVEFCDSLSVETFLYMHVSALQPSDLFPGTCVMYHESRCARR